MKNNLTFSQALEAVKEGKLIARSGWSGKNIFIFMRPEDTLPATMIVDRVKSLPQSVKDYFNNLLGDRSTPEGDDGDIPVKFTAYLCMKAADNTIVNGWLASQTDMLYTDWCVLD